MLTVALIVKFGWAELCAYKLPQYWPELLAVSKGNSRTI